MILRSLIILILLGSCASRPKLYPNNKYKSVGKESAEQDIDLCMDEADEFLESSKGKQILKGAGQGSIVGGAIGAISGLLSGNIVGGAVTGGVIGATAGGAGSAISPDQLKRRYTNRCLTNKKYEIIGWD